MNEDMIANTNVNSYCIYTKITLVAICCFMADWTKQ